MNFIYILLGTNILAVFMFRRDWLLRKMPFLNLLAVNFLLLAVGYLFQYFSIGNQKFVIALKIPVLSQLIFIILVTIFRILNKRDPKDTFWSMDSSLMTDGLFNFVFVTVSLIFPAIIVFMKII